MAERFEVDDQLLPPPDFRRLPAKRFRRQSRADGDVTEVYHPPIPQALQEQELLMFTPILLAILVSAIPSDADSPSPASTKPHEVSVGNMSFSGSTIKLTKSGNETFECEIDGHAKFAFGSDGKADIAITAQRMIISRTANSEITIRCIGDCKLTDTDHACSADRMQIQLGEQIKLEMSGSPRVEFGAGDNRTALAGESITFQGGTFSVSGAASLKRGQ